jgi:hypothetical protein
LADHRVRERKLSRFTFPHDDLPVGGSYYHGCQEGFFRGS